MLADVDETALREASSGLTTAGHQAMAVTCDVSDEAQVAAMVDRAVESFGRSDLAFNNAGYKRRPLTQPTSPPTCSTGSTA